MRAKKAYPDLFPELSRPKYTAYLFSLANGAGLLLPYFPRYELFLKVSRAIYYLSEDLIFWAVAFPLTIILFPFLIQNLMWASAAKNNYISLIIRRETIFSSNSAVPNICAVKFFEA